MPSVFVSVVMAAKNAEATIELAIKSTLKALGKNDELLVGLHRCTDRTGRIVEGISDPRLRVFSYEEGEFADVLNDLAMRSDPNVGYIARMDADDICLPWRFWLQKKLAAKLSNTFLFSSALVLLPLGPFRALVPQYTFSLSTNEIRRLLVSGNPLNHPTYFGPKEAFSSLGGYRCVAGEDLDLWLRACQAGIRLYRSGLPLIIYRLSDSQLSRREDYINGWSTSSEIRGMRMALDIENRSSLPMLRLWPRVKVFLQATGFPTLSRLMQASKAKKQ